MRRSTSVEEFIDIHPEWKQELAILRATILETGLEETIKWGAPCYTLKGKNVIGLGAFKAYVGIWFFQGALLLDDASKLMNAQEGKTKAMRQWRFQSASEIDVDLVRAYVDEAIDNQRAGKVIKPVRKPKALVIPPELATAFEEDEALKEQFNAMSLSCRREYAEYISEAKREATKLRRLQKIIPMVKQGVGLNDKYK